MRARLRRPKSNAAFTSDGAKAANKTDLACLGKGLAYNVTVVDVAGETPRIDDHVAAAPQYCNLGAAQATPLWRGAPDRSRAQAVFSMPTAAGSTLFIITIRNGDDESALIHELFSMTCIVNIHFTAASTPAHNGPV